MCDWCRSVGEITRLIAPDEKEDPVTVAARRLRCYYSCVTQDLTGGDVLGPLGDTTDDEDPEDEWSLDDW